MFIRYGLRATLYLFLVFVLCAAGLVVGGLSFAPDVRMRALERVFLHPEVCFWVGSGLFGAGVLFALGLRVMHREKYLCLKMGTHRAEVAASIVEEAIRKLLKKHFQDVEVTVMGTKKLELEISVSEREKALKSLGEIERELGAMLREKFGYREPFFKILLRE